MIVAYSDVTDYRIDPATGWVEVRPGVPKEALRAVKSVKAKSTVRSVKVGGQSETVTEWTGEIVLHDKLKAAELLCRHLGLTSTDLPDLEVLLNRLPTKVANVLRKVLSQTPAPAPFPGEIGFTPPVDPGRPI